MAETIKLEGLKELDRKLATMPTKLGFKALRSGMMAASRVMFLAAKANAQATGIAGRDAGSTAAAMGRWVRKVNPRVTTLFMGPKNKNKKALALWNEMHGAEAKRLNHFHLLEFGSIHGGAQPFLRPAFEATKHQVARDFGKHLGAAIEKVAKSA